MERFNESYLFNIGIRCTLVIINVANPFKSVSSRFRAWLHFVSAVKNSPNGLATGISYEYTGANRSYFLFLSQVWIQEQEQVSLEPRHDDDGNQPLMYQL